jgi:hypothetical protein
MCYISPQTADLWDTTPLCPQKKIRLLTGACLKERLSKIEHVSSAASASKAMHPPAQNRFKVDHRPRQPCNSGGCRTGTNLAPDQHLCYCFVWRNREGKFCHNRFLLLGPDSHQDSGYILGRRVRHRPFSTLLLHAFSSSSSSSSPPPPPSPSS